jgi:hypothetical protein
MAAKSLPTAKERRRMLAEGSANLKASGLALLAAGRWAEAQECLEAAGQRGELAALAAQALEAGDFFAWRPAVKAMDLELDAAGLAKLAERAGSLGKDAHAAAARALLKPQG